MNRTDRLLAMVLHLQGRRVVRAEDLAGHFEISVRTVYRDLDALGEAGVPIIGEAGVGYTLMKGYHLPPVMLTADEAAALFVGGEMVKEFTDGSLRAPISSALLKVRSVLPTDRQAGVDRLVETTAVLSSPRNAGSPDQRTLLPIQQAAGQRRVLHLDYRGRGQESDTARDVEPLGVVFFGNGWHLIAWCRLRQDFRQFRLDRIRRLAVRDERFPHRPNFSLAEHLAKSNAQADTVAARIWFQNDALSRARQESFAGFVEEKKVRNGAEIALMTYSLPWLARWLLSFGTGFEVLAPVELRDLVQTEAQKIAEKHGKSRG